MGRVVRMGRTRGRASFRWLGYAGASYLLLGVAKGKKRSRIQQPSKRLASFWRLPSSKLSETHSRKKMSDLISAERPPYDTTERSLPILPVRDTVLFPHAVLPLTVGRESSVQLINSLGDDKTIVVVAQREARVDSPQPTDLYSVGTLAVVHKVVKMPNQSLFVFAEGLERVRLTDFAQLAPFMRARVATIPETIPPKDSEIEALQRNVLTLFQQIVAGSPTLSDELSTVAMNIEEPGRMVDFIASSLPSLSTKDKKDVLETPDV